MTPTERADAYKNQQDEIYASFTKDFQKDEDYLASEPDFSAKSAEFAKFKASEMKKYEKTVKGELNEIDDIFSACPSENQLKNLNDRILKTLTDACRKAAKRQN